MKTSPSYRSPWALTILSLLFERDMHPYEIRRLVRHRGKGDFVDLRPGSLYRTIERLERAGLVEPVETTRAGKFPERTVYRITEHGREELLDWMRELLSTPLNDYPQVLQALSVLAVLEADDVRIQLEGRMLRLEGEIAAMETTMRRLDGVLPRLFQVEGEYALALRRAELDWVRSLVEDLRTGRLTWSREQLQAEYGHDRPLDLTGGLEVLDGDQEKRGMA
jgi:DNA-binding PadR family transcriptional regulator